MTDQTELDAQQVINDLLDEVAAERRRAAWETVQYKSAIKRLTDSNQELQDSLAKSRTHDDN